MMTDVLGGSVHLGAGLGAAAACWQAARARTGTAHLWRRLIGIGLLGWSAGQALALLYDLADPGGDHVPSVADAGLLVLPVCALLALLAIGGDAHRLRDASPRRERVVLVLDALLVTGSLLALTWSAVLHPHLDVAGRGPVAATVVLAYPAVDVFLVVMVLLLLFTRPTPVPRRLSVTTRSAT